MKDISILIYTDIIYIIQQQQNNIAIIVFI